MPSADTAWHLDKKVPIALMFTIFLQSATAVWWASSIESRMQTVAQSVNRQIKGTRTYTTVAALPGGVRDMRMMVTDALAPTFLAAPVGGGAVVTPVVHDGTAWVIG